MSNLIQIKRSEATAAPGSLANGELAWSGSSDVLYIGNFGTVTAVGGVRNPGVLTANQALVANSTSGIDSLITGSFTLSTYNVTTIIDDDTFTTGVSNTSLATSESVKAYVDAVAGAGVSVLNDITDVNAGTATEGHVLTWDATEAKWVDADIAGGTGITSSYSNTTDTHTISLNNTTVAAGAYGDANTVATFTVDAQGRLTVATNVDINHDTLLNFVANEHIDHSTVSITAGSGLTGGGTIAATRTINVGAGNGITVNADDITVDAANGISVTADGVNVAGANGISVTAAGVNVLAGNNQITSNTTGIWISSITAAQISDDLVLGTDTSGNYVATITGTANEITVTGSGSETAAVTIGLPDNVTIGQNLTVTGDLIVNGTTTTVNSTTLSIVDPLIRLADNNNSTDVVDIGFYGLYDTSGSQDLYTGFFRDATDGKFRLFNGAQAEPTTTVNTAGVGFDIATLVAHLEDSNVSITGGSITGITDLAVADGGTGRSTFTTNGIIFGAGSSALSVTAAGTEGQVLQAGSGGTPVFGSLDGGTF
jgi:hypothetical protein